MSAIDKQRIAAIRKLEQLGYTFAADDWMHPTNGAAPAPAITDVLPLVPQMVRKFNARQVI